MTHSLVCAITHMGFQGGPFWKVPTGRRDGVVSILDEARNNIPAPFDNITTLITLFGNQGLDLKDLVLLSGTIYSTISLALLLKYTKICEYVEIYPKQIMLG